MYGITIISNKLIRQQQAHILNTLEHMRFTMAGAEPPARVNPVHLQVEDERCFVPLLVGVFLARVRCDVAHHAELAEVSTDTSIVPYAFYTSIVLLKGRDQFRIFNIPLQRTEPRLRDTAVRVSKSVRFEHKAVVLAIPLVIVAIRVHAVKPALQSA